MTGSKVREFLEEMLLKRGYRLPAEMFCKIQKRVNPNLRIFHSHVHQTHTLLCNQCHIRQINLAAEHIFQNHIFLWVSAVPVKNSIFELSRKKYQIGKYLQQKNALSSATVILP